MKDVSTKDGRTVLFVSHNMAAVSTLCDVSLLLKNGVVKAYGRTKQIIEDYILTGSDCDGQILKEDIFVSKRCPIAEFNAIRLLSKKNGFTSVFAIDEDIIIEFEYEVLKEGAILYPSIHLLDNSGTCILATFNGPSATSGLDVFFGKKLKKGVYKSVCTIPANTLNDSTYGLSFFLVPEFMVDLGIAENAISFAVEETGEMRKEYTGEWIGLIRPKLNWETSFV
jgi:lipopolysaccharide transport system ATP-binding protein